MKHTCSLSGSDPHRSSGWWSCGCWNYSLVCCGTSETLSRSRCVVFHRREERRRGGSELRGLTPQADPPTWAPLTAPRPTPCPHYPPDSLHSSSSSSGTNPEWGGGSWTWQRSWRLRMAPLNWTALQTFCSQQPPSRCNRQQFKVIFLTLSTATYVIRWEVEHWAFIYKALLPLLSNYISYSAKNEGPWFKTRLGFPRFMLHNSKLPLGIIVIE